MGITTRKGYRKTQIAKRYQRKVLEQEGKRIDTRMRLAQIPADQTV